MQNYTRYLDFMVHPARQLHTALIDEKRVITFICEYTIITPPAIHPMIPGTVILYSQGRDMRLQVAYSRLMVRCSPDPYYSIIFGLPAIYLPYPL